MKKITFLLLLTFSSFFCQAQFPAQHPELLLNKEVKITPLSPTLQEYGYKSLHKTAEMKITEKAVKHSAIVGKTFKVMEVSPYEKYGATKFKIKLESAENGTYYYDYDPKYDHEYILDVIGGLELPADIYCADITTETDKFTSEIKSTSPYSEGVSFIKVNKDGKSKIYLAINETGSTVAVGKTGLTLLLENGKRIEKPSAPINAKVNSGYTGATGYVFSAFVELNAEDIKLLTENAITDNRLYIYDGTIKNGKKLQAYLNCLNK